MLLDEIQHTTSPLIPKQASGKCKCHNGFYPAANAIEKTVIKLLAAAASKNICKKVSTGDICGNVPEASVWQVMVEMIYPLDVSHHAVPNNLTKKQLGVFEVNGINIFQFLLDQKTERD